MKRFVIVLVCVVAILAPTALIAQDGISLASLTNTVKAMQTDFIIVGIKFRRVNERIDYLEARVAELEEMQECEEITIPVPQSRNFRDLK